MIVWVKILCEGGKSNLWSWGICYVFGLVFISSLLCSLVLPLLPFFCLFPLLCFYIALSLSSFAFLFKKNSLFLAKQLLFNPALFHDRGLSSEFFFYCFNVGENTAVWRCVEIPLWWQSLKSNSSTASLRSLIFLAQSSLSGKYRNTIFLQSLSFDFIFIQSSAMWHVSFWLDFSKLLETQHLWVNQPWLFLSLRWSSALLFVPVKAL